MKRLISLLFLLLPLLAQAQVEVTAGATYLKSAGNSTLELQPGGTGSLKINLLTNTMEANISNPLAGTAATSIATGNTIDTTQFWQRITTAAAATGVIAEAGVAHGQLLIISLDKDAAGTPPLITFAAEATSNVCTGTAAVFLAGAGRIFIWDATDTCWVELGET